MLNEQVIDNLSERLVSRFENVNTTILKKIGENIKKIGTLTPTDALRLESIFKYGGSYEEIAQELAKITGLTVQDIYDIFEGVSKKDLQFAKQFYDYRGVSFIPYEENIALQRQVESIARITIGEFITNTSMLGYGLQDNNGNIVYKGIRETYNQLIDEAILSVSQGKETFQESMYRQLKTLGSGGLRVIYPTTYIDKNGVIKHHTRRLDSVIRTTMQEGLRTLHNANQELIGEDFGYNGIEVSHHTNSAPDHIDTVDGKQFVLVDKVQEQISNGIETEIKQEDVRGNQVKVKGKIYDDFNAVNNSLDRPVSTLNCRHYTFSIIVGVSKPEYTQEQLDEDKKKNLDGFEFEGKHYTNYEGTQLQRNLERAIREQKDTQILAKASGNDELVGESQQRITQLTHKYKELSDISGLPTKAQRLRVSGYKRTKINKEKYYEDVTQKWLDEATPNSHKVLDRNFYIAENGARYDVDNKNVVLDYSQEEKDTAIWIENTFGGEIYMNPRVNYPKNIQTADYLWKNELWDRKGMKKSTSIERAFDNVIKNCRNQSKNFIVDLTECKLNNQTIIKQVKNAFDPTNKLYRNWLEKVIIKRNNNVVKIFVKK